MKIIKYILSVVSILIAITLLNAQSTYTIGSTEYIYDAYYSTTGMPKVVRSEANKNAFLKSQGYSSTPYGYEIDHIIPLSQGGTDDPRNMQLLTVEQHKIKTARERSQVSQNNSNHIYQVKSPNYYSTSTAKPIKTNYTSPSYSSPVYNKPSNQRSNYNYSSSPTRTIYTGPRGGRYYINSNGNKTYVKR
ncbi:HNH endonuclease signature motif containing protein [Bizionia arctica]|uniref:HNH nuclease domain-containing protein n=1 Tax=Bizionia arctica TaxID=1495645 RepID=A0A917LQL6_9FLAO|nr:HNH endonuclease signature motif containing protein [Bizionia arctica]GGG51745.1 hypothetical protein GCM10010976_23620 [Bizionia arctica]